MKKSIEKFVKNKVSFNKIFVQQNKKKERRLRIFFKRWKN
jgi:hypothetical protein